MARTKQLCKNMKIKILAILLFLSVGAATKAADQALIDMAAMRDTATLDIQVLQDWHLVDGQVQTRQKLINIWVGELVPGKAYRVPVRLIVPADRKAKGFHLTGGNSLEGIRRDAGIRGVDAELIQGGVGLVRTMVQVLRQSEQGELGEAAYRRFIKTLDPKHSIQYWGWPATLMRAITAAYAEADYFDPGKVAMSGGSKNGATPSAAILHDDRMTAVHSAVGPIWDSPLRLCDRQAWDDLNAFNRSYAKRTGESEKRSHPFLGGTYGPVYNRDALAAGHNWEALQTLALRMADHVFVSRHLDRLNDRNVDLYFHPGTHDFVAFDIAWGGRHHPQIPIYYKANSGHGQKKGHPKAERNQQNKAAFLLRHFFPEKVEPLLEAPSIEYHRSENRLSISVKFKPGSKAESGRIWWIYDRGPDGSAAYLAELIPDDNWADMTREKGAWIAEIKLDPQATQIDFFSNHRKTISHGPKQYPTYISSPYTRVPLRPTN